jgi:hypothetical protein
MKYCTKEYLRMQYEIVLIIKTNVLDLTEFIIHNYKNTFFLSHKKSTKKKCNISKSHQIIPSYKSFWKLQKDCLSATQYRRKYL